MELVPEGHYRAVVAPVAGEDGSAPVQFGETKEGKPQVLVNFEILDGPYATRVLPWWGSFNTKLPEGSKAKQTPMQRTMYSLRLCGWVGDDIMDIVNQDLGNEVSIQVEHAQSQDGQYTNAKVAWVNKPGGTGITISSPMSKDKLVRFSASLKSAAKGIPAIAGKKAERGAPSSHGAPAGNGWSGNDSADPPKANEYDQSSHPAGDDGIPF